MKPGNVETSKGLKHIFEAAGYTFSGLKVAFHETAFCLEFIILVLIPIVGLCLGYVYKESPEDFTSFLGVADFRMELNRIETLFVVLETCKRAACGVSDGLKTLRKLFHAVPMAHPCDAFICYIAE